jgi:hypothetical protein
MITTIRTFRRPSITVLWWQDSANGILQSEEFNIRLNRDFINTEKIIDRQITHTDDTITVTILWASKADVDAHYNNAENKAYFALRDSYNAANGITTTFSEV